MLDEQEWRQVEPHLSNALREVQEYRATHGVSLKAAKDAALGKGALRAYHDLTGFRETNFQAIWHHRISLYGAPCKVCGKPLRTPAATFCAACGARD